MGVWGKILFLFILLEIILYFCELFGFLNPGLEGRIRLRRLYSHVCLVMIPYLVTVVIVDILRSLWPSEVCLPCATIVTATKWNVEKLSWLDTSVSRHIRQFT